MSCIKSHQSTSVPDKLRVAKVIGSYVGYLPCVDCEAISTVLHLYRDNSYRLTYTYDGKSKHEFVKEGDWAIDKNQLILKGVDYQYKIEPGHLLQLDLSGKEIKGDLAEMYQLSKVQ